MPVGEKILAPVQFARSPQAGFEVPDSWSSGRCIIGLDVIDAGVVETATFAAIIKRAFDLTVECVIGPPHLGGRSFLGRDLGLEVLIYGYEEGMRLLDLES